MRQVLGALALGCLVVSLVAMIGPGQTEAKSHKGISARQMSANRRQLRMYNSELDSPRGQHFINYGHQGSRRDALDMSARSMGGLMASGSRARKSTSRRLKSGARSMRQRARQLKIKSKRRALSSALARFKREESDDLEWESTARSTSGSECICPTLHGQGGESSVSLTGSGSVSSPEQADSGGSGSGSASDQNGSSDKSAITTGDTGEAGSHSLAGGQANQERAASESATILTVEAPSSISQDQPLSEQGGTSQQVSPSEQPTNVVDELKGKAADKASDWKERSPDWKDKLGLNAAPVESTTWQEPATPVDPAPSKPQAEQPEQSGGSASADVAFQAESRTDHKHGHQKGEEIKEIIERIEEKIVEKIEDKKEPKPEQPETQQQGPPPQELGYADKPAEPATYVKPAAQVEIAQTVEKTQIEPAQSHEKPAPAEPEPVKVEMPSLVHNQAPKPAPSPQQPASNYAGAKVSSKTQLPPVPLSYPLYESPKVEALPRKCRYRVREFQIIISDLLAILERFSQRFLLDDTVSYMTRDVISRRLAKIRSSAEESRMAANLAHLRVLSEGARSCGLELIRLAGSSVAQKLEPALHPFAIKMRRAYGAFRKGCKGVY